MPGEILLEPSGRVATIMLNRPDQRNAVSFDGWLALGRIAGEIDNDPDVKVVVLTGAGEKAFSAGANIKDFELHRGASKRARTYAGAFDGAMDAVEGAVQAHHLDDKRLLRSVTGNREGIPPPEADPLSYLWLKTSKRSSAPVLESGTKPSSSMISSLSRARFFWRLSSRPGNELNPRCK